MKIPKSNWVMSAVKRDKLIKELFTTMRAEKLEEIRIAFEFNESSNGPAFEHMRACAPKIRKMAMELAMDCVKRYAPTVMYEEKKACGKVTIKKSGNLNIKFKEQLPKTYRESEMQKILWEGRPNQ